MIEKNRRIRAVCSCLADAVLIFASYVLANYLRFNYMRFFQPGGAGPALEIAQDIRTIAAGAVAAAATVCVLWMLRLYDSRRLYGLWRQSRMIAVVNALCILVFQAVLYLARVTNFSRMVLVLFYYEELTVKEIAALLGVEVSTVTTRLSRARAKLKQQLGEVWQDE